MISEKRASASVCAYQPDPPRGSRAWGERVLEMFNRDRMEDLEELYALIGVPSATWEDSADPPGTQGTDRNSGSEES